MMEYGGANTEAWQAWHAFQQACYRQEQENAGFHILTGQVGELSFYDPRFDLTEALVNAMGLKPPYRKLYQRSFKIGDTVITQKDRWDLVVIRAFDGPGHDTERVSVFTTNYHFMPQECCELRLRDLAAYEIGVEYGLMPDFYTSRWDWLVKRAWKNSLGCGEEPSAPVYSINLADFFDQIYDKDGDAGEV